MGLAASWFCRDRCGKSKMTPITRMMMTATNILRESMARSFGNHGRTGARPPTNEWLV
jgi:hypothetical protein